MGLFNTTEIELKNIQARIRDYIGQCYIDGGDLSDSGFTALKRAHADLGKAAAIIGADIPAIEELYKDEVDGEDSPPVSISESVEDYFRGRGEIDVVRDDGTRRKVRVTIYDAPDSDGICAGVRESTTWGSFDRTLTRSYGWWMGMIAEGRMDRSMVHSGQFHVYLTDRILEELDS